MVVLVSGGADSMCLMHVLAEIHDGPLHVLSVDHGLRAAAAGESHAVVAEAHRLGLPAHVEALGLAPGAAAMERARDARLAVAERVRAEEGLDLIATGHTLTDHVETILFRAARGTGRTGALGIAPRRDRLVRPLLDVSRAEVRAWCDERGVTFVDDPTNADPRAARARVRHGLVPALEAIHPGAQANVARLAELLADEAEVVGAVVLAATVRVRRNEGLDVGLLALEPLAVRRLLVRTLMADAGLPGDALSSEVVTAVLARAARGTGVLDVPGGLVAVDGGVLSAERSGVLIAPILPLSLAVPGSVRLPAMEVIARPGVASVDDQGGAWVRPRGALTVRGVRPGDRIALAGGGHQAVGRLLQGAGVPARRRASVPVVVDASGVVWVAGHRPSADVAARSGEDAVHLSAVPA